MLRLLATNGGTPARSAITLKTTTTAATTSGHFKIPLIRLRPIGLALRVKDPSCTLQPAPVSLDPQRCSCSNLRRDAVPLDADIPLHDNDCCVSRANSDRSNSPNGASYSRRKAKF